MKDHSPDPELLAVMQLVASISGGLAIGCLMAIGYVIALYLYPAIGDWMCIYPFCAGRP